MQYDQVRELLRRKFLVSLKKYEFDSEPIANLLADKLMALEFSRTFSKGIIKPNHTFASTEYRPTIQRMLLLIARTIGVAFIAGLKICFQQNSKMSPKPVGSLVYGLSKEHYTGNSDLEKLGLYLDSRLEIIGLTPPDFYLIQTGSILNNHRFGKVKMVPYIGIEMFRYQAGSRKAKVTNLCKRFFSLVRLSTDLPEIWEIGPDYLVDLYVFSNISHLEIRSLITTQSQMLVLPMVFYQEICANRIMFWYSDNSSQIQSLETSKHVSTDYTYLNQNRINTHYVWTNSWASLLKSYSHAQILVDGPILFKLLNNSQSEIYVQPRSIRHILVFDVTPKKSAMHNSFYSSRNMGQFLIDVAEVVHDLAPTALLTLKPKRKYNSADDYSYVSLVKSLNSKIKRLPPSQDLEVLIREADLVICVPFTSPALLAKSMGKPVLYYSPSLQFELPLEYEGINVVSGKNNLQRAIALFIK